MAVKAVTLFLVSEGEQTHSPDDGPNQTKKLPLFLEGLVSTKDDASNLLLAFFLGSPIKAGVLGDANLGLTSESDLAGSVYGLASAKARRRWDCTLSGNSSWSHDSTCLTGVWSNAAFNRELVQVPNKAPRLRTKPVRPLFDS